MRRLPISRSAFAGAAELFGKFVEQADSGRVAGGAFERPFCQFRKPGCVKAGSQALESLCGDKPVGIAAGTPQQVDLLVETFGKTCPQFAHEFGVVARGNGQNCVKSASFVSHQNDLVEEELRRGLSRTGL